jgi:hypothetical protein
MTVASRGAGRSDWRVEQPWGLLLCPSFRGTLRRLPAKHDNAAMRWGHRAGEGERPLRNDLHNIAFDYVPRGQ